MVKYDFSGWATRNDLLCADGRTIRKDAFKANDGQTVPLVWNHNHNDPDNILGHALLENRDEGVYAYCAFNESESGLAAKEAVRHGDVRSLSIYANKLKQSGSDVLHGMIREVSIVMAGANPGAFIDSVMVHGEDTEEGLIAGYDENIMLHYYTEEEQPLQHADNNKEDKPTVAIEKEEKKVETKEEVKEEPKTESKEKTVKEVFDTLNEEQKTVVYALIGQALEDAKASDEDDDDENVKHSDGGSEVMYGNVFDRSDVKETNVLSHADQQDIIAMAKAPNIGSLKLAMQIYADEHQDTLQHGYEDIEQLFPDFKLSKAGAPELLERDHSWIAHVMSKATKAPYTRVRTRQIDARAAELRAKGYTNRAEEKALSGNLKLLMRETTPQTVYYRDALHRDDINDITDFDIVSYQRNVMKRALEEEIALAALVGDGREDTHADKIGEDHIRPIWKDADLYTIKAPVDIAAMTAELQGTNTSANFGTDFIFTEAVIKTLLNARIKYKGKGPLDFYCAPETLNRMRLARDMNGRRIYESDSDIAKALNVTNIFTVEQFADVAVREDDDGNKFKLLGLFVNMSNYQFGSTKGGEITNFEDFDIDFNTYKYLMETRLSGALTEVYSAIALEEPVTEAVAG